MSNQKMQIVKRNGTREDVQLDKISSRIQKLTEGLDTNFVDWYRPAKKVLDGLYDGVTSVELDTLAAETAASLTSMHPDYAILAGRLAITAHYKETEPSFSKTVEKLHKYVHPKTGESTGLIADDIYEIVMKNREVLDAAIDQTEDMNYSFFGFKTLYNAYLTKIDGKPMERIQHLLMRVAVGIWRDNIDEVLKTYRLLSERKFTHATPTLFNAGTRLNQLSSCFLLPAVDDSIVGMYKAASDMAIISKLSGGIGIPVSSVRATGAYVRGTNGTSNGIIPLLKVYNDLGKHVNQCFAPTTRVHTAEGAKMIGDITTSDLVLGHSGRYCQVNEVMSYEQEEAMVSVDLKHSVEPIQVTAGHPFWAIRHIPRGQHSATTLMALVKGKEAPEWVDAAELGSESMVAQKIAQEVVKVEGLTTDDAHMYGILLGDGHLSQNGFEWGVSGNPLDGKSPLAFVRQYLTERGIHFWETNRGTTYTQIRWASGFGVVKEAATGRIVSAGVPTMPFTWDDLYTPERKKRIHPRLSHLPSEQVWAIIIGLIETDGCVSRGKEITFTNTSRPLIDGLRYQLLRMGVPTSGNIRVREMNHTGIRQDGSEIEFTGTTTCVDVRIPAVKELATAFNIPALTRFNWVVYDNYVFTRVKSVTSITPTPTVYDLKVDGDETYNVVDALVHNGGKRKGSIAVYLEPWHADVFDFLELRKNHGAEDMRARDLFPALWMPDLFFQRLDQDAEWSLFCPDEAPGLWNCFDDRVTGEKAFTTLYEKYEAEGRERRKVKAVDLWMHMLESAAETGTPYMLYKDAANSKSNQKNLGTIKSSNLCCEIIEFTDFDEIAVCNLASLALPRFLKNIDGQLVFDHQELYRVTYQVTKNLNKVIDINHYPLPETKKSNMRHRPIGLGVQGFADTLAMLGYDYESQLSQSLNKEVFETIYFAAVTASKDLAKVEGHYETYPGSPISKGMFQFDMWTDNKVQVKMGKMSVVESNPITLSGRWDWDALRAEVITHGVRNSLLVAPMPTASTAQILDNNESFEAFTSNLYRRQTLSGEFMMINKHLVKDLVKIGEWSPEMKDEIIRKKGSVQGIKRIPEDLQARYKTQWEIKQRTMIDMAAARGAFICQSQSMNLFITNDSKFISTLSTTWQYGFLKGLKTGSYYIRTKGATDANAALGGSGMGGGREEEAKKTFTEAETKQCAIDARETGEDCMACGS